MKKLPLERTEILRGTLDLIVLQTLRWGPRHGYGISQTIRSTSDDFLQVETGSLYPTLHRLEKQGWIEADWATSENNQRVKIYSLTKSGRAQLVEERTRWEQMSAAMAQLLQNPKGKRA